MNHDHTHTVNPVLSGQLGLGTLTQRALKKGVPSEQVLIYCAILVDYIGVRVS